MLLKNISLGLRAALLLVLLICAGCRMMRVHMAKYQPYVRIYRDGERYWFYHNGRIFISLGVNCIHPMDYSKVTDGRKYNVLPLYSNDLSRWASDACGRLKSWHFNTVGAWSHEFLYTNMPFYHTRVVWFGGWGGTPDRRLVDVFSDTYARRIDDIAKKQVAPFAENRYLIGYFANNELPWYGARAWPTDPNSSLITVYMQLPPAAPGKKRLLEFLRKYYTNDFAAFADEWNSEAASFPELLKYRRIVPRTLKTRLAAAEWAGIVAERYFQLCQTAVRRYDTNHLLLGCRFAGAAPVPVVRACGKYCDVVSLNYYRKNGFFQNDYVASIAAAASKPILITEFSWRAQENSSGCPNSHGADVTVPTQSDRASAFEKYATNALAQPYIVGYHWFQYFDQPPAGRFDGEDSNYGLLDIYDNPYRELLHKVTSVNARAFEIHSTSSNQAPVYDPELFCDYRPLRVRGVEHPLDSEILWFGADSALSTYGDAAHGTFIEVTRAGKEAILHVHSRDGWGCGVACRSCLPSYEDGSGNVEGASEICVSLVLPRKLKFALAINESGHGAVDAQNYSGAGHADGEAFIHPDVEGRKGEYEYLFRLEDFGLNPYYGNQRGNNTLDTDAISEICLQFPSGQGDFEVNLRDIKLR